MQVERFLRPRKPAISIFSRQKKPLCLELVIHTQVSYVDTQAHFLGRNGLSHLQCPGVTLTGSVTSVDSY